MKKARSTSSKKRTVKKAPAKARVVAPKRKGAKTSGKTARSRSTTAKRRPTTKTVVRKPAKKTAARKPTKKTTRAAKPKPKAKPAPKRRTAPEKKPAATRVARARKVAPVVPPAPTVPANELKAGVVTHYYSHLAVAVVSLTDRGLRVGDRIHVKGHTSDFYQSVESLQVEHDSVTTAEMSRAVGMKVTDHAREHDIVYLVT